LEALLFDFIESLLSFLFLLQFLIFLVLDISFEMLEPFLVAVQDGEDSLPGLSLVELLDRYKAKLLMREHSGAKLS
jgi:hypothetical protein